MSALTQYRIRARSAAELVLSIEAGVASGALRQGQPLPSVRRLAREVNLSPATVASALAELRRRGVVVSEQRRGTRIGDGPPIGSALVPLPVPEGARDLSRGNPDPALLPDIARALARTKLPVRLYGEAADVPELSEVLAAAPHALLIEDDHVAEVAGCALHSTISGAGAWAATRSVAKALGPDLRLAILAGDERTLALVQGRQRCGPGWVSHVLQRLVLTLLGDPEVTASIAQASSAYATRREQLLGALADQGVRAVGPSGLNLWVPVTDETHVVGALLQRGWVLAPGAPHRLAGSERGVRVTIATLDEVGEARRLAADVGEVLGAGAPKRSG